MPQAKKIRRILIGLAIVSALLAGLGYIAFQYWVSYQVRGLTSFGGGHTLETRPVCFQIAGQRFLIPRNYLIHRYGGDQVRTTAVLFYALLPDLKPYTQETKAEFEKLGWNDTVSILIQVRTPGAATVAESFERFKDDFPEEIARDPTIPDLQVFASRYLGSDQEMYIKLEDGRATYKAICSIVGSHPSDGCHASLDYSKNIQVGYSFGRPHLKNWKAVEEGMRNLFQSFETAAHMQNSCNLIPNP